MAKIKKVSIKDEKEFRETLIHEIGHFVASIFIREQFDKHTIIRIEINEDNNHLKYRGETITENKDWEKINTTPKYITLKLANLYQGCIFQSIYSNYSYSFTKCTENHGTVDYDCASKILKVLKLSEKREAINDLTNDFISQMNSNSEIFEDVFNIDLEKHIEHDNQRGQYLINLVMIENTISQFIINYKFYFKDYVSNLSKILYPS